MSRAKAKVCKVVDLQCQMDTIILTKKDCDMISKALYNTYPVQTVADLTYHFTRLGLIKYGKQIK